MRRTAEDILPLKLNEFSSKNAGTVNVDVDLRGRNCDEFTYRVNVGTLSATVTLTCTLKETADGTTYTDVLDSDGNVVAVAFAAGDIDKVQLISVGLIGSTVRQRRLRLACVTVNNGAEYGVDGDCSKFRSTPVDRTGLLPLSLV